MENFNKEKFKKLEKLADDIHNISVVIDYFCSSQKGIEELDNLAPVIKFLRKKTDLLSSIFADSNFSEDT